MALTNVLTEDEVAALKQSVAEDLGINFGPLTESKAKTFWRTIQGQKMQFSGTPDDGKADTLLKGGNINLRAAMGGAEGVLKSIVDKVKQAKAGLKKAGSGIKDNAAKVKSLAKGAIDTIAALAGDDFLVTDTGATSNITESAAPPAKLIAMFGSDYEETDMGFDWMVPSKKNGKPVRVSWSAESPNDLDITDPKRHSDVFLDRDGSGMIAIKDAKAFFKIG